MRTPRLVCVSNLTRTSVVCSSAVLANTSWTRLVGLLGRKEMDEMAGLLITPSSAIHTLAMRLVIDVVGLNKEHRVTAIRQNVAPWRVCLLSRTTHTVLELKGGRVSRCNLQVGDRLCLVEQTSQSV